MWRHRGGGVVHGRGREHGRVVRVHVVLRCEQGHVQMIVRRMRRSAKGSVAAGARVAAAAAHVVGARPRDAAERTGQPIGTRQRHGLEVEDRRRSVWVEEVGRGLERFPLVVCHASNHLTLAG